MKLISELPSPYRELAQLRRDQVPSGNMPNNNDDCHSFSWKRSKEKSEFWPNVFCDDEETPPIPESSLKELRELGLIKSEQKSPFRVGDRVFDYAFGWGELITIDRGQFYVMFDNGDSQWYRNSGAQSHYDGPPVLSFTEYTLNGFSQVRPEPEIKVGDYAWFWNDEDSTGSICCCFGMVNVVKKNQRFKYVSEWGLFEHASLTPPEHIRKHLNG